MTGWSPYVRFSTCWMHLMNLAQRQTRPLNASRGSERVFHIDTWHLTDVRMLTTAWINYLKDTEKKNTSRPGTSERCKHENSRTPCAGMMPVSNLDSNVTHTHLRVLAPSQTTGPLSFHRPSSIVISIICLYPEGDLLLKMERAGHRQWPFRARRSRPLWACNAPGSDATLCSCRAGNKYTIQGCEGESTNTANTVRSGVSSQLTHCRPWRRGLVQCPLHVSSVQSKTNKEFKCFHDGT